MLSSQSAPRCRIHFLKAVIPQRHIDVHGHADVGVAGKPGEELDVHAAAAAVCGKGVAEHMRAAVRHTGLLAGLPNVAL